MIFSIIETRQIFFQILIELVPKTNKSFGSIVKHLILESKNILLGFLFGLK